MNERKIFQETNKFQKIQKQMNKNNTNLEQRNSIIKSENSKGITLIALVISIIVMLILAGVSLNAVIGDNGIITQAQNATYMQGIAALEEYLQTEYVKYYDEADDYTNKIEMLSSKMTNLCLKDGTKNYITYDGKMYYLVNKQALPEDIKNQLKGGDTTDYIEYIRLIDVYGITEDLRVYYCADGLEGALGTVGDLEVDPSTPLVKVNNDGEMKSALTEALAEIGITVGEDGITVGDIVSLKDFELDGSKYNITSLSAISELTSLQTLTLSNVNVSNLDGIEGCSQLYYVYLKDCKIGDYTKLGTVLDLKYLYIYLSPNINETDANAQVENLGNGLVNATSLNELEYFGISGVTSFYEDNYTFTIGSDKSKYSFTSATRSNATDISGLSKFAPNIKSSIKYMYLNNNKITSIEALEGFNNIYELDLMCNSQLTNLKGLENHTSIVYLTAHACNLTDIGGLEGTSGLKYLTLQTNSNLTNLNGLEQSMNLDTMLAYSCNITDITSLSNHTNLKYLSMYSNVNLENVITLGTLTGLQELYLANNEKMIGTEVRDALANPETHILQNCGGNYSIPSKYNIYFATLTSYDYSNMNLTDASDEINALKNRTNVTRLNLSGNPQLSNAKLQEILSTMTGLKALNLRDCKNLSSVDFLKDKRMPNLEELDVRGTAEELIDFSNLMNNCSNIKTLIIDNSKTNMEIIQNLFEKGGESCSASWYNPSENYCTGLIISGNLSEYNLKNCDTFTKFYARSIRVVTDSEISGYLDFSDCLNLKSVYSTNYRANLKLPSSVEFLNTNCLGKNDISLCSNLKDLHVGSYENYALDIFDNINPNTKLKSLKFYQGNLNDDNVKWNNIDWSEIEELKLGAQLDMKCSIKNFDFLSKATKLSSFTLERCSECTDFNFIENMLNLTYLKINGCTQISSLNLENMSRLKTVEVFENSLNRIILPQNIENVILYSNNISNITFTSNLKNIISLNLNDNNVTDLSPLENIIENGKIKFTSLDLSNNLLQTTTVSGHNNIETLTKLYNAGLRTLNISGNNFTPGSTDSLKNLGWTSYTE